MGVVVDVLFVSRIEGDCAPLLCLCGQRQALCRGDLVEQGGPRSWVPAILAARLKWGRGWWLAMQIIESKITSSAGLSQLAFVGYS